MKREEAGGGLLAATEALLRDNSAGRNAKRTWSLIRIVIVGDGPPVRSFFVGPGSLPPSLPSVHASPPPLPPPSPLAPDEPPPQPPSAGLVARTLFGGFSSPSSIGEAYVLYLGRVLWDLNRTMTGR